MIGIGIGVNRQRFRGGGGGVTPLLLDTYPNAAAAYSLRKLSTTYTGDAIRVRRASDNAELNIGFVGGDLDTSALTTFCSGTDGFVTTIYDQSGGSNDMIQSTAANQPQIVSSGSVILKNGKPIIIRNNVDCTMLSNLPVNDFTDSTFFAVGENNSAFNNFGIFGCNSGGSTTLYIGTNASTNTSIMLRVIVRNSKINNSLFNPTTRGDVFNGLSNYSLLSFNADNFTFQTNTLSLGYNPINTVGYGMLNFQELIIYDFEQTNRAAIETNINSHYGIY